MARTAHSTAIKEETEFAGMFFKGSVPQCASSFPKATLNEKSRTHVDSSSC